MPTFVIAEIVNIHDPKTYDRYKDLAPLSIFTYGGRYAARGGTTEALEGSYASDRYVVLEFPDADSARKWWNSPEMQTGWFMNGGGAAPARKAAAGSQDRRRLPGICRVF